MFKKLSLLITLFLSSCISISMEESKTAKPNFVTSTLIPTKAGFVPATLTPQSEVTIAPTLAVTVSTDCTDSAVLVRDVTIPDETQMKAGEVFTKTWEFKNNGTCVWKNYTLKFAAGDQMNAPLSAPIPDTPPKSTLQISVKLTAPSSNGTYSGYFTINDANGKDVPIGIEKTFWVKIIVGNGTPITQATSVKTPYVPPSGNSNCNYTSNAGYVNEVISLINQARINVQLAPLTVNSQLMSAAQGHSADMACNNFLDHTGSDGKWIGDRLINAGYSFSYYLEIIATGNPQIAMQQWESDKPHWDAVLDPNVTEIGAGYAYYASSDFGGYITVDMGK